MTTIHGNLLYIVHNSSKFCFKIKCLSFVIFFLLHPALIYIHYISYRQNLTFLFAYCNSVEFSTQKKEIYKLCFFNIIISKLLDLVQGQTIKMLNFVYMIYNVYILKQGVIKRRLQKTSI
jgi:hypothetical protein